MTLGFGETEFAPAHGLDGGEIVQKLGAQTETAEVLGVLHSEAISEDDIALGRYDGARVQSWRVNWRALEQRELIRTDTIGEITREDGVFRAELRSGQHAMNVPRGRLYQHMCDARLGVGTEPDATNRLAVRSEAALFTAIPDAEGGNGNVRLTLNKESPASPHRCAQSANTSTALSPRLRYGWQNRRQTVSFASHLDQGDGGRNGRVEPRHLDIEPVGIEPHRHVELEPRRHHRARVRRLSQVAFWR